MSLLQSLLPKFFAVNSTIFPKLSARMAKKMMMRPMLRNSAYDRVIPPADEIIDVAGGAYVSKWLRGPRTVLLLHGWSGSTEQFASIFTLFYSANYSIIAVHPPGHGPSTEKFSHPGKFIKALHGALDSIQINIDVAIGHSMGAAVLAIVNAQRQRFNKLILFCGPANFELVLSRFADAIRLSKSSSVHFKTLVEQTVKIPTRELNAAQSCAKTEQPFLILHDYDDRQVPFADSLILARHCANATHIAIEGSGHSKILKNEKAMAEIRYFCDIPEVPVGH